MKRRNNGAGHIRQKPDGRWEALYYINGERRYITGRKNETAADVQKRLNEALHNLDRGIEAPKDNRQTVGEYLDDWLITKKPSIEYGYWERLESYIRLHIKPTLGKVPLTRLTAQQLQALYTQKLAEGQAPNTVKHLHNAIHVALKDAMRLDLVPRNVADLVSPPKAPQTEMKTYDADQLRHLFLAARGTRLEAQMILMATTGIRLGEALGLTWDAVDFDRAEIRIVMALKDVKNKRTLSQPKTKRSRRTIPLTSIALESLKRHKVRQVEEIVKNKVGWNPARLVFCTTNGTAYTRTNWHIQHWRRLLVKAQLPYVRPHDLRHSFTTIAREDGADILALSDMLGHATVAFTLHQYGHVTPGMKVQVRDTIERSFGSQDKDVV